LCYVVRGIHDAATPKPIFTISTVPATTAAAELHATSDLLSTTATMATTTDAASTTVE